MILFAPFSYLKANILLLVQHTLFSPLNRIHFCSTSTCSFLFQPPQEHIKEYQARAVKITQDGESIDETINVDGDPFHVTDPVTEIRYTTS